MPAVEQKERTFIVTDPNTSAERRAGGEIRAVVSRFYGPERRRERETGSVSTPNFLILSPWLRIVAEVYFTSMAMMRNSVSPTFRM